MRVVEPSIFLYLLSSLLCLCIIFFFFWVCFFFSSQPRKLCVTLLKKQNKTGSWICMHWAWCWNYHTTLYIVNYSLGPSYLLKQEIMLLLCEKKKLYLLLSQFQHPETLMVHSLLMGIWFLGVGGNIVKLDRTSPRHLIPNWASFTLCHICWNWIHVACSDKHVYWVHRPNLHIY